jgi:hypothetical protein
MFNKPASGAREVSNLRIMGSSLPWQRVKYEKMLDQKEKTAFYNFRLKYSRNRLFDQMEIELRWELDFFSSKNKSIEKAESAKQERVRARLSINTLIVLTNLEFYFDSIYFIT